MPPPSIIARRSTPVSLIDTRPEDFLAFMRGRSRVERLKSLFERQIGPVHGISRLKCCT